VTMPVLTQPRSWIRFVCLRLSDAVEWKAHRRPFVSHCDACLLGRRRIFAIRKRATQPMIATLRVMKIIEIGARPLKGDALFKSGRLDHPARRRGALPRSERSSRRLLDLLVAWNTESACAQTPIINLTRHFH
jgi:hypothetical protein